MTRCIATRGHAGKPTVTLYQPCPTWVQDLRLSHLILALDPFQKGER